MLKNNVALRPKLYASSGASGQVHWAHRHLVAQPEHVGGVGSGGKKGTLGFALQQVVHGRLGGAERAEHRVVSGHLIQTTPGAVEDAGFAVAGQGLVDGGPTAQV
ncbi:MAG: hypothetical protein EBU32_12870 [Opitutaceae bacterium]|nr:hypothetical protein [Opitutaceae bacterium]